MPITLHCQTCDKTFDVRPCLAHRAKFCSPACFYASTGIKKICPQCGKEFKVPPSQAKLVHCSRECYKASKRITTTCPTCKKEFWYHISWPRKYCSRACVPKTTKLGNLGVVELVPVQCEECDKTIEKPKWSGRRFCNLACYGKHISRTRTGVAMPQVSGPNHWRWKGGKKPYYGPNWQNQRRNARRRDNYCCQQCGKTEQDLGRQLDVHHIIPFREFGAGQYKEANSITNLICYCAPCHSALHHA